MTINLHGKHLIAGQWTDSDQHFQSQPAHGPANSFAEATKDQIDAACRAAEDAFATFGQTSRDTRARLLERIADELEARAAELTQIAMQESGLPEARLQGERGRTTGQLRYMAAHIRSAAYLDLRHDAALPDRQPLPRPDLRMIQRPIGPVAVFGASNFPLAFSVAGGDTASALAAGCPVVVRAHPAHPGTSEIAASAIAAAVAAMDLPGGVFSMVQGSGHAIGAALVQHPLIRAVGFTGSLRGGRALFDLCAARPEPIPFFGELGSINPVFILPGAAAARSAALAQGWVGSLTMGAGQFCTNPGVVILQAGAAADAFVAAARDALPAVAEQVMLTDPIAATYRDSAARMAGLGEVISARTADARSALPVAVQVSGDTFLNTPDLHHEVFGPFGIVVLASGPEQMQQIARGLEGQLTATLHLDDSDHALAATLLPILERKAGRILANGWPTGVEVADAMVHGGPYPASTNFGATSVGSLSIRRFLRPVSYQAIPTALLPQELREL
jgi:alpha-ketoglutaric semialdehyde dehydrogenase